MNESPELALIPKQVTLEERLHNFQVPDWCVGLLGWGKESYSMGEKCSAFLANHEREKIP